MGRKPQNLADAPGQDSFLDVVANLVGILIILIIVVGVATKKAMVEEGVTAAMAAGGESGDGDAAGGGSDDDTDDSAAIVKELRQSLAGIELDIHSTAKRIETQGIEVAYRRLERDKALTMISAAEKALEDERKQLDDSQKQQLDESSLFAAAREELETIKRNRIALERARPTKGVLEHLPTPMARTVFGKEIHLRLGNGRIAHVPWDELVDKLKADAPQKIWRLKDAPAFTETLGPIDGFWMRYTLKKTEQTVQTRQGTAVQQRAELDRFVLLPVSEDVGEPIEAALKPDSDFMTLVQRLDPNRATITIWTYPDSFGHYRTFKKLLFDRGFLTAARPLPEGYPLGGSPEGSRSSAE